MKSIFKTLLGVLLTLVLAVVSVFISKLMPMQLISGSVFALLIGMALNPLISKYGIFSGGIKFVSKQILRYSIILMGLTLSFSQVVSVGGYSLIVMVFTLFSAYFGGYLLGKVFGMNWKLSSLISTGTGICGGSAIAAVAPTIDAEDRDIAYAISATFIFDILMVILFPIAGRYFGMSDMGFGLWTGTAVNDTSSVVAAGYAFSDDAGAFSVIVKLTRTLSIIPTVLIFSVIHARSENRNSGISGEGRHETGVDAAGGKGGGRKEKFKRKKVDIRGIFPYFILFFLAMVAIKSTGIVSDIVSSRISDVSKFLMVMALGAIGLKTNFKEVSRSGFKPMLHGFLISALVVVVSFMVQVFMGQL